jgi:SAM-dependent methyltransferase
MDATADPLSAYRETWTRKPTLRIVYEDFYDRIAAACRPGLTIEIGGGIGKLKDRLSDVLLTDIQPAPGLDCAADAERLPFASGRIANIVMVDVLHHLQHPLMFFREAARVLEDGGRVLMIEPAITWGSTLFYRLLHHEPVRTSIDPLAEDAIPTIPTRRSPRFLPPASAPAFICCYRSCACAGLNGLRWRPIRSAAALSAGALLVRRRRADCSISNGQSSRCSAAGWGFA